MKSFSLTPPEATAVLRWCPNIEADRKEIFGSRPGATMTLHYEREESRTVALTQLSIAVLGLKALGDLPNAPPFPPVLSTDIRLLGRLVFRLNGLSDTEIDEIDKQAQALAFKLFVGDDDPTKH